MKLVALFCQLFPPDSGILLASGIAPFCLPGSRSLSRSIMVQGLEVKLDMTVACCVVLSGPNSNHTCSILGMELIALKKNHTHRKCIFILFQGQVERD